MRVATRYTGQTPKVMVSLSLEARRTSNEYEFLDREKDRDIHDKSSIEEEMPKKKEFLDLKV